MMFVTIEQASEHLRRDTDADDSDLNLKIQAASASISRYLKTTSPYVLDSAGDPVEDSSGDPIVLDEVRMATLMLVDEFYNYRGGDQRGAIDAQYGYGYLPRPIVAILYPLRTPTMA